jgi:hypothetical protein
MAAYARWHLGRWFTRRDYASVAGMKPVLAEHVDFALSTLQSSPREISGAMRKHQLKLADRQCRMAEISQRIQDTIIILVTALWAHQQKNEPAVAAADILCQDLRRKLTGARASDSYFRAVGKLADMVIEGGYDELAGIPKEEILMRY